MCATACRFGGQKGGSVAKRRDSKPKQPVGYQRHIIGEYRQAGWTVRGPISLTSVHCPCPMRHKTFVRADVASLAYAQHKINWLFNETCYDREVEA